MIKYKSILTTIESFCQGRWPLLMINWNVESSCQNQQCTQKPSPFYEFIENNQKKREQEPELHDGSKYLRKTTKIFAVGVSDVPPSDEVPSREEFFVQLLFKNLHLRLLLASQRNIKIFIITKTQGHGGCSMVTLNKEAQ